MSVHEYFLYRYIPNAKAQLAAQASTQAELETFANNNPDVYYIDHSGEVIAELDTTGG